MEATLVLDWIHIVGNGVTRCHLSTILVLDSFCRHFTSEVEKRLVETKTHLVIVPGKMMSIL